MVLLSVCSSRLRMEPKRTLRDAPSPPISKVLYLALREGILKIGREVGGGSSMVQRILAQTVQ
jgi:hypothetical protein